MYNDTGKLLGKLKAKCWVGGGVGKQQWTSILSRGRGRGVMSNTHEIIMLQKLEPAHKAILLTYSADLLQNYFKKLDSVYRQNT